MARPAVKNFGAWVKARLVAAGVPITDLSRETGISYPSLSNMLNPSSSKPTRQDADTVEKIGQALVRLKVIETEGEAWAAGGFLPEGYHVVKESSAPVVYESDPGYEILREAYDNADTVGRNHLLTTAEMVRIRQAQDAARQGAIGRRREDDDD